MTYKQLKDQLNMLSEEQLDCDITIYHPEDQKFYPAIIGMRITRETDVLDKNHPFFHILEVR